MCLGDSVDELSSAGFWVTKHRNQLQLTVAEKNLSEGYAKACRFEGEADQLGFREYGNQDIWKDTVVGAAAITLRNKESLNLSDLQQ